MANTIDSMVIQNDGTYYVQRYLCLSDGTGMSDVVMIDKSTLTAYGTGQEPVALDLVKCSIQAWGTVNSVLLEWDHTTDDEILAFGVNGLEMPSGGWGDLRDPRSAGGTGDVVITSNGLAANSGFQILSMWRLRTLNG